MAKKIIDVDVFSMGFEGIFPLVFHACLQGTTERMKDLAEFRCNGEPVDVSDFVANVELLVSDKRFRWRSGQTPYEFLRAVPRKLRWAAVYDAGVAYKIKSRVSDIIANDPSFQGHITVLQLTPEIDDHKDRSGKYFNFPQARLVLGFESDEDFVYWRLKYS